jgi:hypothetical protein
MRDFRDGRTFSKAKQSNNTPFIVLALIGLPFLGAALFVGGQQALFVLHAQRTTATFQGAVEHSGGGNHGGTFLYPRFQFTASNGQIVTFTSKDGSIDQPYVAGQAVTVLYNPAAPAKVVLDSFWHLWGPTAFLSVFVFFFLGLPYIIWRSTRR